MQDHLAARLRPARLDEGECRDDTPARLARSSWLKRRFDRHIFRSSPRRGDAAAMVVTASTVRATSVTGPLPHRESPWVEWRSTMSSMQTTNNTEPTIVEPTIIEATIDRYLVMWNEADDAIRSDQAYAVCADDGRLVDPLIEAVRARSDRRRHRPAAEPDARSLTDPHDGRRCPPHPRPIRLDRQWPRRHRRRRRDRRRHLRR